MPAGRLRTTSVAEFGLGIQAWLGGGPFDPDLVEPASYPRLPRPKPEGFFTSSWDEERHTSAWIEFKATTPRASEPGTVWLLAPDPAAVLYVIDSPHDYARLVEVYPHRYANPADPRIYPHWLDLAHGGVIDAVHMTAAAATDPSQSYARPWEVESTWWLGPKLVLVGHGGGGVHQRRGGLS
jgi:hypothetical protein